MKTGAIEECFECDYQFESTYFLIPKLNGLQRFIIYSKNLNKFITAPHFKMEDLRSSKNLFSKEVYVGTVDLKDACCGWVVWCKTVGPLSLCLKPGTLDSSRIQPVNEGGGGSLLPSSFLSSSLRSSSPTLTYPGASSPRRVFRRFSSTSCVLRADENAPESSVGWSPVLGVVASASTARFRATVFTLESSATPPVNGVLVLAWWAC